MYIRIVAQSLFWMAIFFIVSFIALPLILKLAFLEFTNDAIKSRYESARLYLLPLSILLTLCGLIGVNKSRSNIEARIGLTVLAAFASFIFLCIRIFAGMCGWTDERIMFTKATDPNSQIILRGYGCGATDSGYPTYRSFKVKKVAPYLNSVVGIDTAQLDKSVWMRIDYQK